VRFRRTGPEEPSRAFTLVELAFVLTIVGILTAVAIPAFFKYTLKAKTAEAVQNVKKIYEGARTYFVEEANDRGSTVPIAKQFPASGLAATTSPVIDSCCTQPSYKCAPDPALWTDPTWQALKFAMVDPHYYWYSYTASGLDFASRFSADAYGNLDCDALFSTFEVVGAVSADGVVTGQAGFFIDNQLE
jgi:prepilin-type N-terminal cleavage/methylation domain-containing protein